MTCSSLVESFMNKMLIMAARPPVYPRHDAGHVLPINLEPLEVSQGPRLTLSPRGLFSCKGASKQPASARHALRLWRPLADRPADAARRASNGSLLTKSDTGGETSRRMASVSDRMMMTLQPVGGAAPRGGHAVLPAISTSIRTRRGGGIGSSSAARRHASPLRYPLRCSRIRQPCRTGAGHPRQQSDRRATGGSAGAGRYEVGVVAHESSFYGRCPLTPRNVDLTCLFTSA